MSPGDYLIGQAMLLESLHRVLDKSRIMVRVRDIAPVPRRVWRTVTRDVPVLWRYLADTVIPRLEDR